MASEKTPRTWYNKLESYFYLEKFEKCPFELTFFVKYGDKKNLVLSLC
jgi:hypothetical protein